MVNTCLVSESAAAAAAAAAATNEVPASCRRAPHGGPSTAGRRCVFKRRHGPRSTRHHRFAPVRPPAAITTYAWRFEQLLYSSNGRNGNTKSKKKPHDIYTVSQKPSKFVFVRNLCQISTNFDDFWQRDGKEPTIMRGALVFFTSPNLCHNITMWNADVPNRHTTPKVVSCKNFLTTKLAQNKPKYAQFSRIVRLYYSSVKNCQNLCSKCAPRTRTQALRWRRHWLIAASTIDLSNCAHSSIRRVLSSSTSVILEQ